MTHTTTATAEGTSARQTYWAEYGLDDARAWARQAEEIGLHPVTREYFLRQAQRCFELYVRDAGDAGMIGVRVAVPEYATGREAHGESNTGVVVARSEYLGRDLPTAHTAYWVVSIADVPHGQGEGSNLPTGHGILLTTDAVKARALP